MGGPQAGALGGDPPAHPQCAPQPWAAQHDGVREHIHEGCEGVVPNVPRSLLRPGGGAAVQTVSARRCVYVCG